MRARGIGMRRAGVPTQRVTSDQPRGEVRAKRARQQQAPVDDDMAEIEAILKRRGI